MINEDKKSRVSFNMPIALGKRMDKQMADTGYNKKQKSLWVAEALEMLLEYDDAANQVNNQGRVSSGANEKPRHEIISISVILKKKLYDLQLSIKQKYPAIEHVQSRIIRTAIRQRVIRRR